jgi:photoactive yellow protein
MTHMEWSLETCDLAVLENASDETSEAAPFGVIGMGLDGAVSLYNAAESRFAGLAPEKVLGRHFFTAVAPCTNNYMVAQRFETESTLDAMIDYVFTVRMRPTPVSLRLLKGAGARRMYLLLRRR